MGRGGGGCLSDIMKEAGTEKGQFSILFLVRILCAHNVSAWEKTYFITISKIGECYMYLFTLSLF